MKNTNIKISDDLKYCFDSTKKLCQFIGTKNFGRVFVCMLGEQKQLFEDDTTKLCKCKNCLNNWRK